MTQDVFSDALSIPREFLAYEQEVPGQLKAASPGKDGYLAVVFKVGSDGRTYLKDQFVRLPFHITRGLYNDEQLRHMVFLYIQTPSGGIAQGDRHSISAEALEGAVVHMTTQGASKVHRMNKNYGSLHVHFKVRKGAYVEFLPDPVILYRDARFLQQTDLEVEDGGTLLYSEVLIPGRMAQGELFQYEVHFSRIRARNGSGDRLFEDNIVLLPRREGLKSPGILGGFNIVGNLYIISSGIEAKELSEFIHEGITQSDDILAGASTLPNNGGVLVRILGNASRTVGATIYNAWSRTRRFLLAVDAPRLRKY